MSDLFEHAAMLIEPGWVRLSETARSRPGLRETGRNGAQVCGLPAISGRRLADDASEGAAERAKAGEADVEADLTHTALGLPQQEHRALYAAALQIAVRRLAEGGAKGSD